jgi:hypothetical protein
MSPLSTASAEPNPPPIDPRVAFARLVAPGVRLQGYLDRLRVHFRWMDANVDAVVSAADLEPHRRDDAALRRSQSIGGLLRLDLDGDGIVTRAEVVEGETRQVRARTRENPKLGADELSILRRIDRTVNTAMNADLNKDGRIDWTEMQAFGRQSRISSIPPYQYRMIMAVDENGDVAVTTEEFERAAERVFRLIDSDKDGVLSKEEFDTLYRAHREIVRSEFTDAGEVDMRRQQEATKQACALPDASATATGVLVEASGADALSTATIGAQWIATETGIIDIEPGASPLYILVNSYSPVIWQFFGAVDRIERLVLAGESTGSDRSEREGIPLIGAIGVPRERITFFGQPGCIAFHAGPTVVRSQAARATLRRHMGWQPLTIEPRKPAPTVPRDIAQVHSAAIVDIDPRTVFASAPVERYEVLPRAAGLIQLEQDGAITRNSAGEFLVHKKIRFPAGLYGTHQARFRIQKGTPMPEGDPGHSCVIVEETGMALYNGATCAGPFGFSK